MVREALKTEGWGGQRCEAHAKAMGGMGQREVGTRDEGPTPLPPCNPPSPLMSGRPLHCSSSKIT